MKLMEAVRNINVLSITPESLFGFEFCTKDILKGIITFMGADHGAIYLYDYSQRKLIMGAAIGIKEEIAKTYCPRKGGLSDLVTESQKPIFIYDVSKHDKTKDNPIYESMGTKSVASAPLVAGYNTKGILYMGYKELHRFKKEERDGLNILSNIVGVNVTKDLLDRMEYNACQNHISSPIQQLYKYIAEETSKLLDFSLCIVWGLDRITEKLRIVDYRGKLEENFIKEAFLPLDDLCMKEFLKYPPTPKELNIKKLGKFKYRDWAIKNGWEFLLSIPMLSQRDSRQEIIGKIDFYNDREICLSDFDRRLLLHYACWASMAIQKDVLYKRTEKLHECNQIFPHICQRILNSLGADIITMYYYFRDRDELCIPPLIVGQLRNFLYPMITKIYKDDVPMQILKGDVCVFAEDAQQHPIMSGRRLQIHPVHGEQSFVFREGIISSAGLISDKLGDIQSILFINYRRFHEFNEEEQKFMKEIPKLFDAVIKEMLNFPPEPPKIDEVYRRLEDQIENLSQTLKIKVFKPSDPVLNTYYDYTTTTLSISIYDEVYKKIENLKEKMLTNREENVVGEALTFLEWINTQVAQGFLVYLGKEDTEAYDLLRMISEEGGGIRPKKVKTDLEEKDFRVPDNLKQYFKSSSKEYLVEQSVGILYELINRKCEGYRLFIGKEGEEAKHEITTPLFDRMVDRYLGKGIYKR